LKERSEFHTIVVLEDPIMWILQEENELVHEKWSLENLTLDFEKNYFYNECEEVWIGPFLKNKLVLLQGQILS